MNDERDSDADVTTQHADLLALNDADFVAGFDPLHEKAWGAGGYKMLRELDVF
jgi:hypothetical protein